MYLLIKSSTNSYTKYPTEESREHDWLRTGNLHSRNISQLAFYSRSHESAVALPQIWKPYFTTSETDIYNLKSYLTLSRIRSRFTYKAVTLFQRAIMLQVLPVSTSYLSLIPTSTSGAVYNRSTHNNLIPGATCSRLSILLYFGFGSDYFRNVSFC